MFLRKKKYPSGRTGVIVAEKTRGRMRELCTIGISDDPAELETLLARGREWIERRKRAGIRDWICSARNGELVRRKSWKLSVFSRE